MINEHIEPQVNRLTNIRPGRSVGVARMRYHFCMVRTWLYRRIKCPWLRYKGFVRLPWSVDLWSPHKHIVIGHNVQFGKGVTVHCDAEIGNYVLIAGNAAFVGRDDHSYHLPGVTIWDSPRGDNHKVVVEDDVWIGYGAIILSGVTVGRGAVVSAGSLVCRDVSPYAIVGGNPACFLKWRFSDEEKKRHESMLNRITQKE